MDTSKKNKLGQTVLFYLYSAGIGISGIMGLIFFFAYVVISTFHEYSKYPNVSRYAPICGGLCFVVFVAMVVLWFIGLFKRQHKFKSFGISVLFTIAGSIAGYFILELLDYLSDIYLG